ncbi:MAG TPA: molybdopterin-guanine dinucleotide biosynthesis protein B [Acetobacteraceae bacterium]|jgi:molybdopterin-guanine dinucleotide biosynthesis protein B|nr:molybdopterin-guanine dinucleotide biosynthesis protein B [Acetobacteraceae bacterium]
MTDGHDPSTRVIGLAGWNGAGKTTLLERLIPALIARGLRVSTLKHAHHAFDIDRPKTDSWQHRQAGANEVLTVSPKRWALQHELSDEPEPALPALLGRMARVDVVLIEGFKREAHPKIEVHRSANGKPPLYPDDPTIVAVVSDAAFPGLALPLLHLDDVISVADMVQSCARPMDEIDWC